MSQSNSQDDFVGQKSYAFYHPKKSKLLKTALAETGGYDDGGINLVPNEAENQRGFQRVLDDSEEERNKTSFTSNLISPNQSSRQINFQKPQLSAIFQSNLPTCSSRPILPLFSQSDQQAQRIITSDVGTIKRLEDVRRETPVLRAAPQISLQASKVQIVIKEPERKPFKCDLCQHWFYTREKLIIHFITNHGKHHCSFCNEMFESDECRENHEKDAHIPLECDVCKVAVYGLDKHYEDIHDIKNCRFCGVLVKPKSYYKVHVQRKHFVNNVETLEERDVRLVGKWTDSVDTWNFNCHLCGKERKRADIFGHFYSYHRLSLMCLIVFLRTEEIAFSVQGTLTPSGAQADMLDQTTDDSSKTSPNSGISSSFTCDDLQNRSDCTICTKPFTFQVPKPAHDIFCSGLIICRHCSKTFTDKATRNIHMEQEHPSFHCSRGCDKTNIFSQDTELLAHYREIHSEIMCHYCEAFLPNNQLKLADHLKSIHATSNRSKLLEDDNVDFIQLNPKSHIYTCALCNANVTSSMNDIIELFQHLQYHKISLLPTLQLLENLQTNAREVKTQVKTKKPKKGKNEENLNTGTSNALDEKGEYGGVKISTSMGKKVSRAAKAKKLGDFKGNEFSMLTSQEKNGCKRRETVIKKSSSKMKKKQGVKEQHRRPSGDRVEKELGSVSNVTNISSNTHLAVNPDTGVIDSSSDLTTDEEDFGSEEPVENSTEEDEDVKNSLGTMNFLLPLEIEIGEAEIDPTEIECVVSDTSDDESYEHSLEIGPPFEVKQERIESDEHFVASRESHEMSVEMFESTSRPNAPIYQNQQNRETVLKHSFHRNVDSRFIDSVERRMEDMFHESSGVQIRREEQGSVGFVSSNGSKGSDEVTIGVDSSSRKHSNAINNHSTHKNSLEDNDNVGIQPDQNSTLMNKNFSQEALNCHMFKNTLKNIKTDPDDVAMCIISDVHHVLGAKDRILKCELCTEEKSNFTTAAEYMNHMKTCHKFTISAHCTNISKKNSGDTAQGNSRKSTNSSDRGDIVTDHQCPFCALRSSWKTAIRQHVYQAHFQDCAGEVPIKTLAYKCRYCSETFWRVTDRNEHQIVKHDDQFFEFYKCYVCSQISSSKLMLTRHLKVSHPAEPQFGPVSYKCKLCLLTYPSLGHLREHFTLTHPSAMVFPCRQCNITLKNKKTLKTHFKNVHMDGTTTRRRDCTLCGKTLYSKRAYAIHYRMKHSVSSKVGFRCRICQKRFDTKDERKMHYAVGHLGESPYHCGECGKGFASKSGMYGHKQLHTGSGISKCEYCGKEFTRKDSYNEHLLIHNGPRHKCPHCPKDFVQRSNLVRHIRIHTGEKPYKCLYCEKCFSDKGACNSHIRVHTREETCSCPYCGQTFSKKQKLKYHIRKHTGEGLIHCEVCAKSFTNSFALKEHRLIHNRETQILCGTCGKGFNSEKYLQRHVAIVHEPLQMFSCPLCEKSFTQMTRLKAHLMTHTGVKHMKCLLCDKAYSVRKSLRRHLLEKHDIAPEHPQYKRCFYALSPAEAGLQLPSDLSCFAAYDDDSTTQEEVVKNIGKRSPRKPMKKPVYAELPIKEQLGKKVKRKVTVKKVTGGKVLGGTALVEVVNLDKPSTSKVIKKRQKALPKKLIISNPKAPIEDSSCSCGESKSLSDSSAETEATTPVKVEIPDAKEPISSHLAKSTGPGKKKQRVEAIVEILQKTSSSPSGGSTNPEEDESNIEESSDNEPILARILPLNFPKNEAPQVTGVGRRKLGQKSVPEKLSRKEKRSLSFLSIDDSS